MYAVASAAREEATIGGDFVKDCNVTTSSLVIAIAWTNPPWPDDNPDSATCWLCPAESSSGSVS